MEGSLKRQILTDTGEKILEAIVWVFVVGVVSVALAGFNG